MESLLNSTLDDPENPFVLYMGKREILDRMMQYEDQENFVPYATWEAYQHSVALQIVSAEYENIVPRFDL